MSAALWIAACGLWALAFSVLVCGAWVASSIKLHAEKQSQSPTRPPHNMARVGPLARALLPDDEPTH